MRYFLASMRTLASAALVLAVAGLLTAAASPSKSSQQLRCKYGVKYVTKKIHGHNKRVKVCKKKPKPKPPPPQADLELTMRASLDQVTVGNHVAYTFVVENNGPEVADGTTLTVDLPPGAANVYG
jgi:uncharacterized repeat protein (TIGR01451 family)